MNTTNVNITKSWLKVVNSTTAEFTLSSAKNVNFEIALTSADVAPSIIGHTVLASEGASRTVMGEGYVWIRVSALAADTTSVIVVTQ